MKLDIPETVDSHVIIQSQHSHRTWHASLPNGKIIMAFLNEEDPPMTFEPGANVPVCLTVADFSRGLIVMK
jgi:hypothetical protein